MSPTSNETFEPDDLALLGHLFDEAWIALAPSLTGLDASAIGSARARLAGIMLELTKQQLVAANLKERALAIFHRGSGVGHAVELHERV